MRFHEVKEQYGIRFKKGLGQNLLLDDNINRIMVDAAAISAEDDVVEVGAGLGALTRRLAPLAKRVLAAEIDPSFMPCLEDQFDETRNVYLFRGDILNHRLDKLCAEYLPGSSALKMVSNLPYYITTPVLFHFWESETFFSRMVVMVQEEVGLRLTAPPGTHEYGVLSLAARLRAEVDIVHRVPRTCFRPMPKVDSCIVRMRNREQPLYPDLDNSFLMQVIRTAFMKRRKTLKNTLGQAALGGLDSEALVEAIQQAGIDPGERPQRLELDQFAALARAIRDAAGHSDAGGKSEALQVDAGQ